MKKLLITALMFINTTAFTQTIIDVGVDTTKTTLYMNKAGCPTNTFTTVTCDVPFVFDLDATGFVGDGTAGNDLDCDGDGDVGFSVENSVWFEWCNPTTSAITVTVGFDEPGGGNLCNIQGAVFVGPSLSPATINAGILAQYSSNPGGNADGFTFTVTVPVGECAYFMVDGYAGNLCNGVSAVVPCPAVLPIELMYFDGENVSNSNKLQWSTVSEINNDYFLLERSEDGYDWVEISKVSGSGNSTQVLNYRFNDYKYTNVVNYYRLSQVDFNGQKETFNIISIDNTNEPLEVIKMVNMMGQEVDEHQKGFVIYYYSDGTYKKLIK